MKELRDAMSRASAIKNQQVRQQYKMSPTYYRPRSSNSFYPIFPSTPAMTNNIAGSMRANKMIKETSGRDRVKNSFDRMLGKSKTKKQTFNTYLKTSKKKNLRGLI